MKKSVSLILVFLLFASVLSVSIISANVLGSWFDKLQNSENIDSGNKITGNAFSLNRAPRCGDRRINQANEQCDIYSLGGKTCQTQGFSGGKLKCSSLCQFDTSGCTTATNTPLTVSPTGTSGTFAATTTQTQKTCEQITRRFNRATSVQCNSGETVKNLVSRTVKWFWKSSRTVYYYSCVKTTTTECSLTSVCPTGTMEIGSVGCSLPSGGISPNAYIVEDPGNLNFGNKIELMQKLGNKFYQTYPQDNYDFIAFYFKDGPSNFVLAGESFMHQLPAQQGSFTLSPARGHGISDSFKPIALGSAGKLKATYEISSDFKEIYVERIYGSVFVDYLYFAEDVHELTHWWGVFLPNELQEATAYDPATNTYTQAHWEFLTGSWISNSPSPNYEFVEKEGKYYFKTDCTSEPKQHDFDLYSMGLINDNEVTDKLVLNGKRGQIPGTGFIRCDTLTEVSGDWIRKVFTIQDMISVLGSRIPSSVDAQKDFNMAFVMVVPQGQTLTSEENAAFNWLANKFPIVWYKTTKGKSTLNGIIPQDLTPPIISNVQSDMVPAIGFGDLKTINVTFDTNEPTMSYLLYTDPVVSTMYPTIMKNPPEFSTHYNIKPPVLNRGREYNVKIISIDENYNMVSYDVGTVRTEP